MLDAAFLHSGREGKERRPKKKEADEDYKQAAALAALVAPYRHSKLTAAKLAGDPNNPIRIKDDATAVQSLLIHYRAARRMAGRPPAQYRGPAAGRSARDKAIAIF
jgi:hypothetical protein